MREFDEKGLKQMSNRELIDYYSQFRKEEYSIIKEKLNNQMMIGFVSLAIFVLAIAIFYFAPQYISPINAVVTAILGGLGVLAVYKSHLLLSELNEEYEKEANEDEDE